MLSLDLRPTAEFWEDFATDSWERRPTLLAADLVGDPFTLEAVFDAVCQRQTKRKSDRFWAQAEDADGTATIHPLAWSLLRPQTSDRDFDGFFERLSGLRFGANIQSLERGAPAFGGVLTGFSEVIANRLNPKPLVWRTDVFFGDYPLTPFGIHRDPAGVLSVALLGTRHYHFWEAEEFNDDDADLFVPRWEVVNRHLDSAETITVSAGQAVYWPSDRWHIVSSESQPFVSAQVSGYFEP